MPVTSPIYPILSVKITVFRQSWPFKRHLTGGRNSLDLKGARFPPIIEIPNILEVLRNATSHVAQKAITQLLFTLGANEMAGFEEVLDGLGIDVLPDLPSGS